MKMMRSWVWAIVLISGGLFSNSSIEAQGTEQAVYNISNNTVRALPPAADNRTKYLRAPFEHRGHPCAFAGSISYNFTYEVNLLRDLPSNTNDNQYPYTYGYFFHNNGSTTASTADVVQGYQILMATGVPNNTAMGGFEAGFQTSTWLNGYDKYYQAMHNRIQGYNYFDLKTTQGLTDLKQWLYDHASGTTGGGMANINVESMVETDQIPSGAQAGKTIITSFGTGTYDHTLTVVGYNDSVAYDLNGNGSISTDEKGAFILINSHIVWDNGFAFCPYKLFTIPYTQGGIGRDNKVYYITKTLKDFQPKYTLKATITHTSRSSLKIYAGISPDVNATQPTKVKYYAGAFNYAGGAYPMLGVGLGSTIEIGLDVTDLIDSIGGKIGAFFMCIDSKTGGSGKVDKLSLMDYTQGTPQETPYKNQNVTITGNIKLGGIVLVTPIINTIPSYTKSSVLIKPNPVMQGKNITLVIPQTNLYGARITFYSVIGQAVLHKTIHQSQTADIDLSTTSLALGIYNVLITMPNLHNSLTHYNTTVIIVK